MHRATCLFRWIAAALLLSSALAHGTETIPLYVGYADPPLGTERSDSLTLRLAAQLSVRSQGRYHFVAMQLPRNRLNLLIARPNWKGVVAWANPVWFKDEGMRRYAWSQPYMRDANLVVSNRQNPLEYSTPASLLGTRLGCISGQRYAEFDALFREGRIIRDDVPSELQNMLKLRLGRVDAVLVQASSMPYLRQVIPDLDNWLHIARTPRGVFQRYLFTNRDNADMLIYLNSALREFDTGPQWSPPGH
ncbi:ABC transporter substrate-binding protein [Oxalobacteraceae bacterium]|nr:ABC transporter substrate-binding protein [Oxalobacteraceae bacterium]